MQKLRRQTFEQRSRAFLNAADYINARPLLLWSPYVGKAAKSLIRAVAKDKQRTRTWNGQKH